MHDIRFIRDDPAAFDAGLARRGLPPISDTVLAADARLRAAQTEFQTAQARRNEASKAIGGAMGRGEKTVADELKAEVAALKDGIAAIETEERAAREALDTMLAALPNLPAADVPDGLDEDSNVEVARWGTPRGFDFAPQEHADFGPALGLDFETAAKMSGARFAFLRGPMARLERALGQFMLDVQTGDHGFTECAPPLLVRDDAVYGTGQLPKFSEDLFRSSLSTNDEYARRVLRQFWIENYPPQHDSTARKEFIDNVLSFGLDRPADRRWLIPTSEVVLTNSVREEILDDAALPLRLTALTPCFRSEAGSAGRDTRGYIRQHQFDKVELVAICRPDQSEAEHQHIVESAETVLRLLDLPYRRMLLCAGDMGFAARKTFDLEVWLPGQNTYREISSCSNCGDFQARRMNSRFRPDGEKTTQFVHTLNGSGLAVGRTLVAVLENYQQADGSVTVPDALLPYMGGLTKLSPT